MRAAAHLDFVARPPRGLVAPGTAALLKAASAAVRSGREGGLDRGPVASWWPRWTRVRWVSRCGAEGRLRRGVRNLHQRKKDPHRSPPSSRSRQASARHRRERYLEQPAFVCAPSGGQGHGWIPRRCLARGCETHRHIFHQTHLSHAGGKATPHVGASDWASMMEGSFPPVPSLSSRCAARRLVRRLELRGTTCVFGSSSESDHHSR